MVSCKKDDIENPTEQNNGKYFLSRIQASDFKENPKLNEKISELKTKSKSSNYQARYDNETFELDMNEATYIENLDGSYHSYTFYIYNDENNSNINNIVLSLTENGNYEADLVTYSLTQEERQLIDNGVQINLIDKMSIEPFDINQINTYSKSGSTCAELVYVGTEDCSCHSTHAAGGCTHPKEIYEWQTVDCVGGGGGSSGGDGTGTVGTGAGSLGGNTSGDGSSGGGKATSLTGIDNGPRKNPCQSLNALTQTDSLSLNIKPYIDTLRTKTSLDKEWSIGFEKKQFQGELYNQAEESGFIEGKSKTRSKIIVGNMVYGQAHTHPTSTKPIFSWLDLKAIKTLYTEVHEHFQDDVFLMIVNHDGSVYSLKVNDIETLNTALDTDLTNADGKNNKAKEDYIDEFLEEEYNKSTDLEQTFLRLYGNHGISLYKATDTNLSNWTKLELDSEDEETVTETPCN